MWLEYFEQYLDRVFPRFLSEKPWNYKDDLCMVGAEDLYCATGSESWREPVRRNSSFLMDDAGRVANWVPGEHNIDKVSFGKSMRILRDVTGEARWAEGVERAYRILADYPRTVTGNFWHKDIYPDQVWLDGLYMGMPFYAACLTENGEDHWDDILDQFTSAHKLLWDEQLGLYRHANDCSRKMEWADPVTGQSPVVWLRAEGWFAMAVIDTWELMPPSMSGEKDALRQMFQELVDAMLPYQDKETGMWHQVINLPNIAPNYLEESGSAIFANAIMKGVRLGVLDSSYYPKGRAAFDGICRTCLSEEDGKLALKNICLVAGLGNKTHREGTFDYYMREPIVENDAKGVAPLILAYIETMQHDALKGAADPASPCGTCSLDDPFDGYTPGINGKKESLRAGLSLV